MNFKNLDRKLYYILNILISLILFPFFWLISIKKKPVIIFGFGNGFYENNIRFLYEYFLKNNTKYDIYTVFSKTAHDRLKVDSGKLLYRGSIKAYLYFYKSKGIVFDMSDSDVAPGIQKFCKKTKKFYLNHGMEGLKNVDYLFKKRMVTADYFFSCSDFEKSIRNKYGVYPNTIVTGYPRLDQYYENRKKDEVYILMFLTWRNYLTSNNIEKSEYYNKLLEIIKDEEINEILKNNNKKMYVKIHHEIGKMLSKTNFVGLSNIIISQEMDLPSIINNSFALISDYSSIAWDYIWQNKPVLFYQFDKKEYEERMGPLYTDVEKDGLGYFVNSIEGIREKIEQVINNPVLKISSKEKYFKYLDNKNTQRIYNFIENELALEEGK